MNFRQNNAEFYISNNKENLVIAIGDSWTFGDSLGNIPITKTDDINARKTQCYGKHLADSLDADLLNCGYCGYGNIKIIQKLYELVSGSYADVINKKIFNDLKDVSWGDFSLATHAEHNDEIRKLLTPKKSKCDLTQYKNIYYFVTLTETGRQFEYFDWMKFDTIENAIISQENIIYQFVNSLVQKYNINLVVGRNFSTDYNSNTNYSKCVLPLNWVQLNYNYNHSKNNNSSFTFDDISRVGPITGIALDSIARSGMPLRDEFMKYFIAQYDVTKNLRKWLANNPLHHNIATCHPTKESHKLWADYLLAHMD